MELALSSRTSRSFDDTVLACREALVAEGFGVLTDIDLAATFTAKLGVDHEPYRILGACHAASAAALLRAKPEFGVLLPCSVTISTEDRTTVVRAIDPRAIVDSVLGSSPGAARASDEVQEIATEIGRRLERALTRATTENWGTTAT